MLESNSLHFWSKNVEIEIVYTSGQKDVEIEKVYTSTQIHDFRTITERYVFAPIEAFYNTDAAILTKGTHYIDADNRIAQLGGGLVASESSNGSYLSSASEAATSENTARRASDIKEG